MSRLVLVTGSDPDTLLRAAAAPFLVEGRAAEPLPILALRQGGLRDEVHRLASEAGAVGWVGAPIRVFAELPALIIGEWAPIDEFERRALLHAAVAQVRPTTLPATAGRTLVDVLDRLFGELVAGEVGPEALRDALASLDGDAWERGRDADVVALYAEYRRLLGDRADGRDGIARAAQAVRECPDAVRQRLRRPFDAAATPRALHLYGLADLRDGWGALLDALHASDVVREVRVYLTDPAPGVEDEAEPLRAWLRARADEVATVPAGRTPLTHTVVAVAAPDMTRELDHVARAIKHLIVRDGVKAHEIAVIARKARPHLTRAAGVFAAHGIPVHARLRHTLAEVPALVALLRLFHVAAGGWRISELEALAASPYFAIPLDREVMRAALRTVQGRGLGAWRTALADLLKLVEQLGDTGAEDAELPSRATIARAVEAFDRFAAAVATLDERRTAGEWIALTQRILGDVAEDSFLGYGDLVAQTGGAEHSRELEDAMRLDAAALLHADELLAAWNASLAHDPAASRQLDALAWAGALEEVLMEAEVTLRTGHAGGVHLLEALSAEGRSFAHLFVLGLESGSFPADAAPDPLFAEDERRRLAAAGIPVGSAAAWLGREGALFHNLLLGARESVRVSWCYADANGAPQLPSAFAEELLRRAGGTEGAMRPIEIPGSAVVAGSGEEVWSGGEALRYFADVLGRGAVSTGDGGASADAAAAMLALTVEDPALRVAAEQMLHAATIEQRREAARAIESETRRDYAHPWNGDVSDDLSRELLERWFAERVWSATQLERIGRCGFAFLAGTALGVRAAGEVDPEDADARDVGSARHVALARIYPRLDVVFGVGEPTEDERARITAVVREEVERAIGEQGGAWTRLTGLRRARVDELTAELTDYIAWEMKPVRGQAPRQPVVTELAFGMDDDGLPPAMLDAGEGRTVRLRGQIDRVDAVLIDGRDEGWRYVVDHKSSAGALADLGQLQPAGAVLQLALYLHVLRQVQPEGKVWGGTYQIVRGRDRKASLMRCSLVKKGVNELGNDTQQKHNAVIEGAATLAGALVDTVLAGQLPARTPGTTDCLAYCDFRDVCREERMKPRSW